MWFSPLGAVISFKHSEYTVGESAGRVAITIQAAKSTYYTRNSCYVEVKASVNKDLGPYYGNYMYLRMYVTVSDGNPDYLLNTLYHISSNNSME